jgi:hypothetical protein
VQDRVWSLTEQDELFSCGVCDAVWNDATARAKTHPFHGSQHIWLALRNWRTIVSTVYIMIISQIRGQYITNSSQLVSICF